MHRRHVVSSAAALLLAAGVGLTGCSSAAATFDDAVGQGIAAVETARLAVDQHLDDRTFATTANTALDDARRELVDASMTVSKTDAATETEAALRADVLDALSDGVSAVNDARDAMAGVGSFDEAQPALDRAAQALAALEPRTAPAAEGRAP
jgi:hypothetical protein